MAEETLEPKVRDNYIRVDQMVVDAIELYKAGLDEVWYDLNLGWGPTPAGLIFGWWLTTHTRGLLLEPKYVTNVSVMATLMPDAKDVGEFVLKALEALKADRARAGAVNNGGGLTHG